MDGIVGLVGGGEFSFGCEMMDAYLLKATETKAPMMLIVPTAAAQENPQLASANGLRYFSDMDVPAREVMILNASQANDEDLVKVFSDATHIYFTGGDPEFLLDVLRGSKLIKVLADWVHHGGVLVGSSAGAMVLGSKMLLPMENRWVAGLDLVGGIAVLPHQESRDPALLSEELKQSTVSDVVVLAIDTRTCCVGRPSQWRVVGEGKVTVHIGGRWQIFKHGDVLPALF